jgi:hypothetical protein
MEGCYGPVTYKDREHKMSGMFTRHGWSNVIVALSLAVIPFLMLASSKQGTQSATANPAAMASVEMVQQ